MVDENSPVEDKSLRSDESVGSEEFHLDSENEEFMESDDAPSLPDNEIELEGPDHTSGAEELAESNEGWADAMQKILKSNKPKRKKTIVLAKAKKLSTVRAKELKTEAEENDKDVKIKGETKIIIPKDEWIQKGRVKPEPLDRNKEKTLQKVAVRGVIQLFNAVTQLQKSISTSTPSTFREEKVLKSVNKDMFLSLLKGTDSSKSESKLQHKPIKTESEEELEENGNEPDDETNTWNVLKNNFMTSGKMKNWDITADKDNPISID